MSKFCHQSIHRGRNVHHWVALYDVQLPIDSWPNVLVVT